MGAGPKVRGDRVARTLPLAPSPRSVQVESPLKLHHGGAPEDGAPTSRTEMITAQERNRRGVVKLMKAL